MDEKQTRLIWSEICFLLNESIKPTINEKDFETQVIRAIEKLGWLEWKGEIKRQPTLKLGRNVQIRPDLVIYDEKDQALVALEIKRPDRDISKEEPASQLTSYMLQMKAEFGLMIGSGIRLYYDGKHNAQQKPVLLERIPFEKDSEKGPRFVSIFLKENMLQNKNEPVIKELYDTLTAERNIKKLRDILISQETKAKVLEYLKNEFMDFGSDVVEGALEDLEIQFTITTDEEPEKEDRKTHVELSGIRKTVFDTIKKQKHGITRSEIVKITGFEKRQVSNALYRLNQKGLIQIAERGTYTTAGTEYHLSKPKKPGKKLKKDQEKNLYEAVYDLIKKHKNGISVPEIREQTQLGVRQVSNALYKLVKRKMATQKSKGIYVPLNQ